MPSSSVKFFGVLSSMLIFVFSASLEASSQDTWGSPTPHIPFCSNTYSVPKYLTDGTEIAAPKGELYCIKHDRVVRTYSIPLFEQIQQLIEPGQSLRSAFISFHFVRSKTAAAFVCSLTDDGGKNIALSVQSEQITSTRLNEGVLETLSQCFENVRTNENVSVCFLQTNHDFQINGMTNTVHARSILLETSVGLTTMIGSAHFRDGAIFRNSEQQIFLKGAIATAHKKNFFEPFLGRCVEANAVGLARN